MYRSKNLILVSILLPLWLVLGRGLLGSFGWMSFLMVMGFPVLLIPLALVLLFVRRPEVRESGQVQPGEGMLLWLTHLCWFVLGFFLVDGGDTEEHIGSVFTVWFGKELLATSSMISAILALAGLVLALVCLVDGIRAWRRSHRAGGARMEDFHQEE